MKTYFTGLAALVLAGFALCSTGCVTEYHSIAATPAYSGTTLPAASRVALVMEFRGGEPTAQAREDVRVILTDYLAEKGSMVVEQPSEADYMVYAVLERRNPDNPSEWTVVSTSSARSLGAPGGDEFEWPVGIIEDEEYETSTFSYVGFGLFYPIWFDVWDRPWYHGRVIVCPPPHRPSWYWRDDWRHDRRWHRPHRWQDHDRHDRRRPDWDRRDRDRPRDGDRRDHNRPDTRDRDRRDNDRRDDSRHDNDRRDHDRRDDGRGNVQQPDPQWRPGAERPNDERRDRARDAIRERDRDSNTKVVRPNDARRSHPQPGTPPRTTTVAPGANPRQPTAQIPPPVTAPKPPIVRRDPPRPPQFAPPPASAGQQAKPVPPPQRRQLPLAPTRTVRTAPQTPPSPPPASQVNPAPRPRVAPPAAVGPATRSAPRVQPPGGRAAEVPRRKDQPQRAAGSDNGGRRNSAPREQPRSDSDKDSRQDQERK